MQAVQIVKFGPPDVLKLMDIPVPVPAPNQVLVRVHAAGLNPVDWKTRSGLGFAAEQIRDRLPWTPGYDISGTVEQCGTNVSGLAPGDPVFGMIGFGARGGGYAEYALADATELATKPLSLPHPDAAGVPLAALTAWQALIITGKLVAGETVLIHAAAGGVGHFAVQLARHYGARVITTASPGNHEWLYKLGAEQCIDYTRQDFTRLVDNIDLVIDGVGGGTGMRSLDVLSPTGRLVCLPTISAKQIQAKADELGLNATGILVHMDREQLTTIAGLLDQGKINVHIEKTYSLTDAPRAHQHLETGHVAGKLVLTIP